MSEIFQANCSSDASALNPQKPFDVAVIIPTVLRPQLRRALESVYAQQSVGSIQVLIGIDKALGSRAELDALILAAPANVHVSVLDPGYSTSQRHGGMHACFYGGALRTVLSFLANSQYVAYLDDDDWFGPDHLSSMLAVIKNHDWAYSLRWYAHPQKTIALCVDLWESVGPDQGAFKEKFGGFVAPSCLMLDKIRCARIMPLWANSPFPTGDGEDRLIFDALITNGFRGAATNQASSYYTIDPNDVNHPVRLAWMRRQGVSDFEQTCAGPDRLIARARS
ncbi:hypothetical protein AAKU67_002750 [Oxalobacteraceae bacterium GrIS 2.11]